MTKRDVRGERLQPHRRSLKRAPKWRPWRRGEALTCDEVVLMPFEFQAHVVGAELLELDGETDLLLRLVAGHQHIWVHDGAAGIRLVPLHQVQFVVFIRSRRLRLGTDDVQLVPDFWIDHKPPSRQESRRQQEGKIPSGKYKLTPEPPFLPKMHN